MAMESLTDTLRETLGVFGESGIPWTTTEVAARLDVGRRTTYNRLDRLAQHGRLETKKVGANARVWWRPATTSMSGTAGASGVAHRTDGRDDQLEPSTGAVANDAIFTLDPDGHVRAWNPDAERVSGYEAEEFVGEHCSTLYTDEDQTAGVPETHLAVATEKGFAGDEGWLVRADGTRFWASVTITAMRGEDGVLEGFATAIRDTTGRRGDEWRQTVEAERLLRQRDNLIRELDTVFERVDDGFYALDDEFRFDYVNDSAETYLGASESELLGRTVREALEVDGDGSLIERFETAMATQESTTFEHYSDSLGIWMMVRVYPSESGLSVYFADVTERKERERELEQYETIVETVNDGIYTVDPDGRFTMANETYAEMTGYSVEELLGSHVSLVIDDDVAETAKRREQGLLAGERDTVVLEATIRAADGRTVPAEATFTLIPGRDGTEYERVGVVRDITERRQAEVDLRESEERFRTMMEQSPFSVQIFDAEGRTIAANPAWERLWGASREELDDYNILQDEQLEAAGLLPRIRDAFAGEVVTLPVVHYDPAEIGKPGRDRWIEGYVYPLVPGDGERFEVALVHHDVTEGKERERELERYEMAVETVWDGITVLDSNDRFVLVNEAFYEITGYARGEVIGEHATLVLDESTYEQAGTLYDEVVDGGHDTATLEFDLLTADGGSTPVEARFGPCEFADGTSGGTGVIRDVTERRERERELEEARNRYRTLVANFPNGAVTLVDEDLRYVTVGGTPIEEADATVGDLEGQPVGQILPANLADVLVPRYADALDGEVSVFEERVGDKVYEFRVLPVRNDDGDVFAAMGMSQDITERERREQALREAKLQLEAATEAGAVGTWEWQIQEDRFVTGPSFARMFGVDPDAAQEGVSLDQFVSAIHEDDRDRVERAVDEAVASRGEYEAEYRVWNAEDELRWVMARGHVEWDAAGNPSTFPGALTDITERKRAELELERQREQLAALNSLNEVAQDITEAVIEQSTREEIEAAICEGLTNADAFTLAWIGDVDPATQTLDLRAASGVVDYLDGLTISVDPEDVRSRGPGGQAFLTHEVQVTRDIRTDERFAPWRDRAEAHGIRSTAGIPIEYDGRIYGVLGVYAERPDAFAEAERRILGQLGEVVGHAIATVEHKQALMSDEVVELEFYLEDVFAAVGIDTSYGGRITLDHAVPTSSGEFLVYGTATEEAQPALEELVDALPQWKVVSEIGTFEGTHRFELRVSESTVLSEVASRGGYVETFRIEDGDVHLVAHLPPTGDARAVEEVVTDEYPTAELLARRQLSRTSEAAARFERQIHEELTDRQRAALEVAFYSGFFDWPRETTGEEVAGALGVSSPTFHQHLRKAERKVVQSVLSTAAPT